MISISPELVFQNMRIFWPWCLTWLERLAWIRRLEVRAPLGSRHFQNIRSQVDPYIHTSCDIHVCCWFWCSGSGQRFSNRKEPRYLPLLNAGFEAGKSETPNRQQTQCQLTNWLSYRGSSKNSNWTARPYNGTWAFSTLDFTADWLSHLALVIYMFVVDFDALAQASNFRIEGRQVISPCRMQDSKLESLRHLIASRLNAHSQTDWAIEDQAKTLNSTARPYDEWAFSPPTRPHYRLDFAPGSGDIHVCCC